MTSSTALAFPLVAAVGAGVVYLLTAGRNPRPAAAELARLAFLAATIALFLALAGAQLRLGVSP